MSNNSDSTYGKISSIRPIDDMPNDFDSISIRIASATEIKDWAKRTACKLRGTEGATWPCPERGKCDCGEVKNWETLNYRTFRAEPKGLFCEAIFGPQRDWRCHCGKYRRMKHEGKICEECTVEVTHSKQSLEAMIMDVLPVIPAGLREILPLGGGRYATSDLNDLYRRIINRNNRTRKHIALNRPQAIIRNEHRMLQEAADSLFDNQQSEKRLKGPGNRRLMSVTDMFREKHGGLRRHLLGKSVDYSGASPIIVDPELKIYQCGLPKQMAIKLFEPFIVKKLIDHGYAQTIKRAKHIGQNVDSDSPVWDVLPEIRHRRYQPRF